MYRMLLSDSQWAKKIVLIRLSQGVLMGCGAPLGWAMVQFLRGRNVLADITANPILYLYMLVGTTMVFGAFGWYVGRQEGLMRQLSLRDSLTGVYNLRHFRDRLDAQITEAQRQSTPLSLIFFDLDHFKKVNDSYGHGTGDTVLKAIAQNASIVLRRNELLARIGGEEFAVLLPNTSEEQARRLAERILEVVRHLSIPVGGGTCLEVTMSLGVACLGHNEGGQSFVERADAAMYQAKKNGRNQVFVTIRTKAAA